jgi:hypothetical protein
MLSTTIFALSFCALASLQQQGESLRWSSQKFTHLHDLQMTTSNDNYEKYTFVIPIGNDLIIQMNVPKDLKLITPIEDIEADGVVNFVAKHDHPTYDRSRIFSILPLIKKSNQGKQVSYINSATKTQKGMENLKEIKNDIFIFSPGCQCEYMVVSYFTDEFTKEKRKELLLSIGWSDILSPNGNAVIIQYAKHISNDTDENKEWEEMKKYLDTHEFMIEHRKRKP